MKTLFHFILLICISSFSAFGQGRKLTSGTVIKAVDGEIYYMMYRDVIIPINKADIPPSSSVQKLKRKDINAMMGKLTKQVLLKERNSRTVYLVDGENKQAIDASVLDFYYATPLVVNVEDGFLDKFKSKSDRISLPKIVQGSLRDTLQKVIAYKFKKDISKSINSVDAKSIDRKQLTGILKLIDKEYQNS